MIISDVRHNCIARNNKRTQNQCTQRSNGLNYFILYMLTKTTTARITRHGKRCIVSSYSACEMTLHVSHDTLSWNTLQTRMPFHRIERWRKTARVIAMSTGWFQCLLAVRSRCISINNPMLLQYRVEKKQSSHELRMAIFWLGVAVHLQEHVFLAYW